jgi:hypothetical protein
MIEVGDLVRIKTGVHHGELALVMGLPLYNVARVRTLERLSQDGYIAYNTDTLEKL